MLLVFALCSCGGSSDTKTDTLADSTASVADSLSGALKEDSEASARKHNADNFFAISYLNDGVYVGNNVEMLRRISIDGFSYPVLSPDGNTIAYSDSDTVASHIHLYDISTGEDSELDFGPFCCRSSSFDSDGNILAFTLCNLHDVSNVYIYNKKNLYKMMLSREGDTEGDYNPTFSPDGAYLVFHNMRNVKIYSMNNGVPKFWQNIDCENFCQRNGLALTPDCKFQMTSDHRHIVYSCRVYSDELSDAYRLLLYDIETSSVKDIISDDYSCNDFQVSDEGCIYYIQQSPDSSKYLYMADLENLKPVRMSSVKLGEQPSLSIAY